MAGLCLWGDLTEQFAASSPVAVEHCLESVKILPPPDAGQNDPELYGNVTQEAMARMESAGATPPTGLLHGRVDA